MTRQRWKFPYSAKLIQEIDGHQLLQDVRVTERFSGRCQIESSTALTIKDIAKPILPGIKITVDNRCILELPA